MDLGCREEPSGRRLQLKVVGFVHQRVEVNENQAIHPSRRGQVEAAIESLQRSLEKVPGIAVLTRLQE